MIDPTSFVKRLALQSLRLWAGVPDSLLADLCAAATDALGDRFVITANEGNAIASAVGWHVATGEAAVVFMQNSGEGNAVNPLLSLADPEVYSIPMMLIIGWRGEPGVPDEPQHAKQGKATLSMLEVMDIPYEVLDPDEWESQVNRLLSSMRSSSRPVALVVRKGVFSSYLYVPAATDDRLTREEALGLILDGISPDDLVVATTGKCGREVYEIRTVRGEPHDCDLLCVGGMGHTLSVAWGMAIGQPARLVWCIDGDGSMLMHMGSLAVFAQRWPENLRYIVNINGAHESVGGQPNVAKDIDVVKILAAFGFPDVISVRVADEVICAMHELASGTVGAMVLYTRQGSRADLGRPKISPAENKRAIMKRLSK